MYMEETMEMTAMQNSTMSNNTNITETNSQDATSLTILVSFARLSIVLSLFDVIALITGIVTLYKCEQMACSIRRLGYSVLLSDIALHMMAILQSFGVLFLFDSDNILVYHVRAILILTFNVVSQASVAGLTLDRLVAVKKPLTYKLIINKTRVNLMVLIIWLVPPIIVPGSFVVSLKAFCNWDLMSDTCDPIKMTIPTRLTMVFFNITFHTFVLCAYVVITMSLRERQAWISQQRSVAASNTRGQQFVNVTNNIIRVVMTYEIVHLPMFINFFFVFIPYMQNRQIQNQMQAMIYICLCLNSWISLYFYVWKINDCKNILLKSCSCLPSSATPRP